MTKQEFLNKLSHEELLLRDMVSSYDVTAELKKRKTKFPIDVKVGDCFVYRNDCNEIYLTKIFGCNPENHYQCFNCEEISINGYDIDSYEVTYYLEDFSEHDRIDSEIFNKISALVNNRDNAVNKICEEFNKQIRELCSILLNTQNKN